MTQRDQTASFFACASCGAREPQTQGHHVRRRLSELSLFQFDDVVDAERRRRITAAQLPFCRIFSVYGLPATAAAAESDSMEPVSQGADATAAHADAPLPASLALHHLHPELVDPPNAGPSPIADECSAMVCAACDQYVLASIAFDCVELIAMTHRFDILAGWQICDQVELQRSRPVRHCQGRR